MNLLKVFPLLSLILLPLKANASCVDISGKYHPPYEDENSDVITTIIYTQFGCDSLLIGGMVVGKPHFESQGKVFGLQKLFLKGEPAPKGFNCLYNSLPGVCASYLATKKFILKTAGSEGVGSTFDPVHGGCTYTVARLSKDSKGSLLETPQGANCEDGFVGEVAPVIWPKAK
jgi:hypothetical protein